MKALTIRQPWASLICCGAKDIENRKWQPKENPGRLLIHASSKKVPADYGLYISPIQNSVISNLRTYGICPDYKDMPLSAIVGYVEVMGFTRDSDSLWADAGNIHWQLHNAFLFDKPILRVEGKPGQLFDYPLEEDNLPQAHQVKQCYPIVENEHMTVRLGKAAWHRLHMGTMDFTLDIIDPNTVGVICQEDSFDLKPVKEITFIHDDSKVTLKVDRYFVISYFGKDRKDVKISFKGQEIPWLFANYILDNNLQPYGL